MFNRNDGGATAAKIQPITPETPALAQQDDDQRPAETPDWAERESVIGLSRPIKVGRDGDFVETRSVTVKPVRFSLYMELGDIDRAIVTSIDDDQNPTGFDLRTDRKVLMNYITRLTNLSPPELDQFVAGDVVKISQDVRRRVSAFSVGNSESGTGQTS